MRRFSGPPVYRTKHAGRIGRECDAYKASSRSPATGTSRTGRRRDCLRRRNRRHRRSTVASRTICAPHLKHRDRSRWTRAPPRPAGGLGDVGLPALAGPVPCFGIGRALRRPTAWSVPLSTAKAHGATILPVIRRTFCGVPCARSVKTLGTGDHRRVGRRVSRLAAGAPWPMRHRNRPHMGTRITIDSAITRLEPIETKRFSRLISSRCTRSIIHALAGFNDRCTCRPPDMRHPHRFALHHLERNARRRNGHRLGCFRPADRRPRAASPDMAAGDWRGRTPRPRNAH